MNTRHQLGAVLTFVALAGCASSVAVGDGGPADSSACATRSAFTACVHGSIGGACDTTPTPRVCRGGAWVCPAGTIPASRCGCFALAAGACTCTADSVLCEPVTADAGAGCGAAPAISCSQGAPGRVCGDYGEPPVCVGTRWRCPPGFTVDLTCGCNVSRTANPDGSAVVVPGGECPMRDPSEDGR